MRGTPPAITVEVGPVPTVIEASSSRTTLRFANAQLTLHGSDLERRALVEELARSLDLRVETRLQASARILDEARSIVAEPV